MNVIILFEGRSHSNDVSVTKRVDQYSADEKSDTVVRCILDMGYGVGEVTRITGRHGRSVTTSKFDKFA
jgi:hypothetical protein